ncbi:RraA family protein [Algoriphagus halophytocola]|uniref:RraA family protein n=1 Tax=Algoriphagus halophytocola TaxID=2991499 RepID=A0ABY6MFR0_9BACT|nr:MULTISPECIES: RraA family protein [unclassified Algoriphagus]UZD22622.1 RraA family protein [Algoriphagus sp. TR-M5]WBL43888.1 RraA family protein [Algoriphagus sp. TR-M9]
MTKTYVTLLFLSLIMVESFAQQISREEMLFLTQQWTGERFEDGRPKVSDDILRRMKEVSHDEAWAVMKNEGYRYQYADGWGLMINPDSVLVGRALTATFMPGRPDIHDAIDERGKKEGKRGQNSWPVDLLQQGDVYVVDQFGIHNGGPTIGDNVGNAIYAKSGNGIVYDGAIRDVVGLKEIGGFTSYVASYHPSHHNQPGDLNTMLIGINKPTRIHQVTVMAGDVVLGRDGGVSFIPAHLAEKVVVTSEVVRLRDMFGHQRLREGTYTAGQIDTRWSEEIEKDFSQWLEEHIDELPIAREQIQEILKKRTW